MLQPAKYQTDSFALELESNCSRWVVTAGSSELLEAISGPSGHWIVDYPRSLFVELDEAQKEQR